MDFNKVVNALENALRDPLPGADAHEPMRAIPVGEVKAKFDHKIPPKQGSVLILLYQQEGLIKFPLIKRAEYIGTHSAQVSFPGGKAEAGEDVYQTALRETEEEIGISREHIHVLGRLTDFFVIPSNFVVTPVVAFMNTIPVFIPDPYEVARIISANTHDLVSDDSIRQKEILVGGTFRLMAPHFEIEDEIVWGATAMMLNEFRILLKRSTNFK
jgi:8-oxo-dGTP pyrophosphatase MutT (NUDIX family)